MFTTKINNLPGIVTRPFIVAQYDEGSKSLWYYGQYDSVEEAQAAARSVYCHNGIICYKA